VPLWTSRDQSLLLQLYTSSKGKTYFCLVFLTKLNKTSFEKHSKWKLCKKFLTLRFGCEQEKVLRFQGKTFSLVFG
jgi:hypothetical protein